MADNIVNIQSVNPDTLEFQTYQQSDSELISSFSVEDIAFTSSYNKIEYYVLDANQNVILSNYDFKEYNLENNSIVIDPTINLTNQGFDEGQYYTLYNFVSPILNSSPTNTYFISEISSDRTELRLASNNLDSQAITNGYNDFVAQNITENYFPDFYLNFGDNNLVIANNILLVSSSILIKLYEPLPPQFDLKSQLWAINKLSDSIAYFIELITVLDNPENIVNLRGPNLNLNVKDKINNSTDYTNYTTLQTSASSSLSNQLNNILLNKSIRLNIDYSDYSNFIHFSSAETRLENFYYKLSLIEQYNKQYLSSSLSAPNYYLTSSQNVYLNKIKEIEEGFDGYEYYLYYSSGSTAWPKSNSTQPYINYPSTSSQGSAWLTGQLSTASLYDSENKDALVNGIPLYLREDPSNAPYELFIEMLGQQFDTLYLYYGEVSNKYNADNRIDAGVSRDLISDILKDFGVKIYQNNFSTDDLYSSFLGITNNLGLLPPTGSELITNYVTASNEVIPLENVNVETYKRIYHNLPLLFKKKGTVEGLRLLINLYGIPDTILRISEFGGKNKLNANDWDQFQNQFNYEFFSTGSGYLKYDVPLTQSTAYGTGSYSTSYYGQSTFPSRSFSTEFRFKTTGIPTTSSFSQSLACFSPDFNYTVVLEYSGSGYASGSYNGSIADPYNQYGTLKLITSTSASASVYLPFFNSDWWSVLVTIDGTYPHTSSLFAKNKIYDGYEGNKIGFQASSSVNGGKYWLLQSQSFFLSYPSNRTIASKIYTPFSGSFQELRFYTTAIDESVFDDYVMNPYSIEGNELIGSQDSLSSLIFRAPLGSVLDISGSNRTSIHPSITNYPPTQSFFFTGSSNYKLSGSYQFLPNKEVMYLDQFPAGIKNIISSKIKIEDTVLPGENVLSPFRSLQQDYPISESYTRDVNYVEVAFSPQNEINDDITSQLGYFNIGDYIGDPRQLVNTNATEYPDFNRVRDYYFQKYQSNYNLKDYVRLIKYFDNSLFKLIKDFVPARTSLAAGVVIKQHLLERNRYSPAQASWLEEEYTASVKSFPYDYAEDVLVRPLGGTGGVFPDLNGSSSTDFTYPGAVNITQSWIYPFSGPTGLSYLTQSSQDEFFNGEFEGATILVSTGSLNGDNTYLEAIYQTLGNYNDLKFWDNSYQDNAPLVDPGIIIQQAIPAPLTSTSRDIFLSSFLSSAITAGRIYIHLENSSKVSYIKLSKFNSLNVDNSTILNTVRQLSIQYSNGSVGSYIVSSIIQSTNYYVYKVEPAPTFYIPDGNMSYYEASASNNTTPIGFTVGAQIANIPLNSNFYNPYAGVWYSYVGVYYYYIPNFLSAAIPVNTLIDFEVTFNNSNPSVPVQASINRFSGGGPANYITPFYSAYISGSGYVIKGSFLAEPAAPPTGVGAPASIMYNLVLASLQSPYSTYVNTTVSNITVKYLQRLSFSAGTSNFPITIPLAQQIINFEHSDYQVLEGNLDEVADSQYYDLVEYDNYSVSNNYFNLIVNGGATPSNVKDYYYLLNRQIKPRYIGSRNTSDGFNTINTSASFNLQDDLKISLQPSIKEGVAYNYDTTILEFEGGKQSIELPNLSRVNISQILNVETTSSVTTYLPTDLSYSEFIKAKLPLKSKPIITQYSTDVYIPSNTTIVSNTISPKAMFMITDYPQSIQRWNAAPFATSIGSPAFFTVGDWYKITDFQTGDDFAGIAQVAEGIINETGCIFRIPSWVPNVSGYVTTLFTWTNGSRIAKLLDNTQGFAIVSSIPSTNYVVIGGAYSVLDNNQTQYDIGNLIPATNIRDAIYSGSIYNGERWFISLMAAPFTAPISLGTTSNIPNTFTSSNDPIDNPFGNSGAFEINPNNLSLLNSTTLVMSFLNIPTGKFIQTFGYASYYGGQINGGFIIWKSSPNSNTVFFNNTDLTRLGPGNMITTSSSPSITENLNYITQNFGNKPQN
jgi:hypothetical protein